MEIISRDLLLCSRFQPTPKAEYRLSEGSTELAIGAFGITVEPVLKEEYTDVVEFSVKFGLDNISGTFSTSRLLSARLKALLEKTYHNLRDGVTKDHLKTLNKRLTFNLYVKGSIYQFNSYALAFKILNYTLDNLKLNVSDNIQLSLSDCLLRPSFNCAIFDGSTFTRSPSRTTALPNASTLSELHNGTKTQLELNAVTGVPSALLFATI